MFWNKKKLQWTPRPGVYPSRKLVEKFPELGDLENNPHFRMCVASPLNRVLWNRIYFLEIVVAVIFLKPILDRFINDIYTLDFIVAFASFVAFARIAYANEVLPFMGEQSIYAQDSRRCVDYFILGIRPSTIVAGLMGLGLRQERLSALWQITAVGLLASVIAMFLDSSDGSRISSSLIIYWCCFRLGVRFWPVGIAARGTLAHAMRANRKIHQGKNPFMYWAKNLLPLVLAGLMVSALCFMTLIGLDYAFVQHRDILPQTQLGWMLLTMAVGSGLTAIGMAYALYCMRLRKYYLKKAEEVVAEILEMKREEIFGLKPSFLE